MENHDEKVVLSAANNVVNFKIPDWNDAMVRTIKDSPLYKLGAKQGLHKGSSNMLMFENTITTNGWDTVSICRVSALNAKIKADKTYPERIDYAEPDGSISLNGDFAAWQVTTGGDGKNVKLNIPMANGTFKGLNRGKGNSFDLTGVSVDILVKLQYFPIQDPNETTMPDNDYTLSIDADPKNPSEPIAAVINLTDPTGKIDEINKSILRGEFENWLNIPENLKKFDTLFATILINNMGEQSKEFQWLRSTYTSYAYTDQGTEESSIFGILCMTNNNPHDNLPNQLPAVSLKADNNALFIISRESFIKYQLLPSLPYIFEGSKPEDFVLDKTGLVITSHNLKMDPVKVGLINYYPKATNFEITFDNSFIQSKADVDCEISPGIVSHTTIITKQTLGLDVNDKGEQIMTYVPIGDPDVINNVDVAIGIIITEAVLTIIGAVVTGIAGWVAGKCVAFIVGLIAALVVGIVSIVIHVIIEKAIAEGVQSALPSISPMVQVATSQIKWPFCCNDGLDLTDINYSGALIFEGNLDIDEQFTLKNGRLICA